MKTLIDRTIEEAVEAHKNQARKGTDIPYITHPLAVGIMLAKAGCSDDVIIAGILHDTIEDTQIISKDIREKFGNEVALLVEGASEPDRSLPREDRKRHTHEYLKTASPDVKFVVLADKLHNMRTIASDYADMGDEVWQRFNRGKKDQEWYYQGLVQSLRDESADDAYRDLQRRPYFRHYIDTYQQKRY